VLTGEGGATGIFLSPINVTERNTGDVWLHSYGVKARCVQQINGSKYVE
jgi:hypothetical protein